MVEQGAHVCDMPPQPRGYRVGAAAIAELMEVLVHVEHHREARCRWLEHLPEGHVSWREPARRMCALQRATHGSPPVAELYHTDTLLHVFDQIPSLQECTTQILCD